MKKLKNKVFWTLLLILTLFLLTVLIIYNSQLYFNEVRGIKDSLEIMSHRNSNLHASNKETPTEHFADDMEENQKRENRMFMDVILYSIDLDEENKIINIICHNEEIQDIQTIEKVAQKTINRNKVSNTHVGNLYLNKYSYKYQVGSYLIIVDNTKNIKYLRKSLLYSLVIFIILQSVIILISKVLTKWIITPVEESFIKQKQFIQDASHELKTPLAVIMASSEALEKENKEKWIKSIQHESERMSKLIKSLLDLAKVENFNNKQNYKEENLSKIVEKQVLTLESLMFEKNIHLDYDIAEDIYLLCDSLQIKELLSILLDNAIKHSTSPGKIRVTLKKEKGNLILDVINKGNPIPKGMEEKIFERFFRADESRNRDSNRYGLGLSIAKNIVSNHNGTIVAESKDGYTNFKVIIKTKKAN